MKVARITAAVFMAAALSIPALLPVEAVAKPAKLCKAIQAVDPDNDGKLDLGEAKKAASAVFKRLEKDKDGTLDKAELKGRLSAKELAKADPDKDKTIDLNEYLAVVEARFKAANKDGDGTIECKELGTSAGQALLRLLK